LTHLTEGPEILCYSQLDYNSVKFIDLAEILTVKVLYCKLMGDSNKRVVNPQQAAKELEECSPLSEKQAVAYVYFKTIDDPQKQAPDIFHIPENELKDEIETAENVAEAAKIVKKTDVGETDLKDKMDILVGCGFLKESQADAFRTSKEASIETASKMLDRPVDDIRKDSESVAVKIEKAREMYNWLHQYSGTEAW